MAINSPTTSRATTIGTFSNRPILAKDRTRDRTRNIAKIANTIVTRIIAKTSVRR